jgi:hypothetical protein
MNNAYKNCYRKNLEEASLGAYEFFKDNIKIGNRINYRLI